MWKLVNTPVTYVCFLLVLATTLSLVTARDIDPIGGSGSSAIILIIAFIKISFVGQYFMEIRHAPGFMKLIFNLWCLIASSVIIYLVCFSGS
jgi:uncharacterized membrane protein YhaH (DUF805 family)